MLAEITQLCKLFHVFTTLLVKQYFRTSYLKRGFRSLRSFPLVTYRSLTHRRPPTMQSLILIRRRGLVWANSQFSTVSGVFLSYFLPSFLSFFCFLRLAYKSRRRMNRHRSTLIIHAEHIVHRRGYCFHFGCMFVCLYVCMYVTALERKRLIGMT